MLEKIPLKESQLKADRESEPKRSAKAKKNGKSGKKKVLKKSAARENDQKGNITKKTVPEENSFTPNIVKEKATEKGIPKQQPIPESLPKSNKKEKCPQDVIAKVKEVKKVLMENISNKKILKESNKKTKNPQKRKSKKKISMAMRFPIKKLSLETIQEEEPDEIIEFDCECYPL
ncbi:unnamed protein product [Oikopleura dioica]|uniref:Uncharacterized protein n=1 Tax=Oikopleura dioica TaxID=34765 RepID=E4WW17_OIKDI|nr:unnamed protein product [Oikopleura dioica]